MEKTEKKKSMRTNATYNICIIAMFVAIITVCTWAQIPTAVIPITLQTMAVCLAAALLGWKRGLIAVAAYILLGLVGVPVFSSGGGVSVLAGVTGGYIIGFLFTALIVGIVSDVLFKRVSLNKALTTVFLVVAMVVGVAVCYAFGTGWYIIVYGIKNGEAITLSAALSTCVVPFIVPDLIKIAVAVSLSLTLKRFIK